MKCPKCGSENVHVSIETTKQGFSGGKGCCGAVLLGPIGLLCGLCGKNKVKSAEKYWLCNNCGAQFTDYEAMSSGGGVSFVPNRQATSTNQQQAYTPPQQAAATQADNPAIEIPTVTYSGSCLRTGHLARINDKIFFDSWGICVKDGDITRKITDKGSFLFTDGEFVYGQYTANLKDKRHIIRIDPNTYNCEYIASFTHSIVDAHMNNGIFAFANDDDKGTLYIMDKGGAGLRKLADDKASHVTVRGEWVYYINSSDNQSIYKININSNEKVKVYGEKKCLSLVCAGDYLYFESSANLLKSNLFRIREGGVSAEMIIEDSGAYVVTDTGVFIKKSDDSGYCISFHAHSNPFKKEILLKVSEIGYFNVDNGYLYYGKSSFINSITHRLNLTDGQIEEL